MGLFDAKPAQKVEKSRYDKNWKWIKPGQFTDEELPHASLIQQRRCQMLIHSRIYYVLDENLIADYQFDKWGKELVELQEKYPDIASRINYAEAFRGWDASTGAFLPLEDEWVVRKAAQLLQYAGKDVRKNEYKKIQQSTGDKGSKGNRGKTTSQQRGNNVQKRGLF